MTKKIADYKSIIRACGISAISDPENSVDFCVENERSQKRLKCFVSISAKITME